MDELHLEKDPHSYYASGQPKMTHLEWIVRADFNDRVLHCLAILRFAQGGRVDLDMRGLDIDQITDAVGRVLEFQKSPAKAVVGECLSVVVPDLDPYLQIHYRTRPDASGLQWLTPAQTRGKHPFLFSQGEPLHARSYVPCQDTPGVRFTFDAQITVPRALRGLMGAKHISRTEYGETAIEKWRMPQAIPAYLIALAVGDLQSRDITERSRVWAAPEIVEAAAADFADVGRMMEVGEELFGPYEWERFDMLVLPPSFPFGGMENPRLTFLTPALITGDKSMAWVVGHELAHSWTGNLITNADWSDFWLNEGWTTYAEWRIHEAINGHDATALEIALRKREMLRDFENFARSGQPHYTALASYVPAETNPDDLFSRVPYCKGALFLITLEQAVGRERFDAFIRSYIARFRFQSITTAQFMDFVAAELPGVLEKVQAWRWVYGPGLPESTPEVASPLITEVEELAGKLAGTSLVPFQQRRAAWSARQWKYYLEILPRPQTPEFIADLEDEFSLSMYKNTEVRQAFLLLAAESGYAAANPAIEEFLGTYGRTVYLKPIYKAMAQTAQGLAWARRVFERVRAGYHPITVAQMERVLKEAEARLQS